MRIRLTLFKGNDHDRIIKLLEEIQLNITDALQQIADISAKVDEGNASLDGIKADIQALKDQLAAGGLTATEEAQVQTAIDQLQGKIDAQAQALADADAAQ